MLDACARTLIKDKISIVISNAGLELSLEEWVKLMISRRYWILRLISFKFQKKDKRKTEKKTNRTREASSFNYELIESIKFISL